VLVSLQLTGKQVNQVSQQQASGSYQGLDIKSRATCAPTD